ncbi:hypothetical protein Tco_0139897 [Tanacetum coccineum]
MHPGKLKSKWYGPNVGKAVYPYGTVEITDKNGISFKVNGQRLKKYHDGNIVTDEREVLEFEENTTYGYSSVAEGDLRKFSNIGAWVQAPRCMAWLDYDEHVDSLSTMDNEVGVTSPESTTQTLLSFEEYIPPVTYPEEVENTLGSPIEVETLSETKLEEVGLNCNHNTPFISKEVPSFDGLEPQPLLNSPSLDMFDDDWGLESKEVAPLGEELSLFDRPNEVEISRILEAHRLESILQQQFLNIWIILITMVIFDEKKLGSS